MAKRKIEFDDQNGVFEFSEHDKKSLKLQDVITKNYIILSKEDLDILISWLESAIERLEYDTTEL